MRHSTLLLLILIAHLSISVRADHPLTVRGRIVCLDESDNLCDCDKASSRFALHATDGKLYRFLPTDVLTAMFADQRVRQMELQINGRIDAKDRFEIIRVQAVRDGSLSDVYYYCFVCSITAYAPGPCVCCGEDVKLIVTPAALN
jgi:hypothetical protein